MRNLNIYNTLDTLHDMPASIERHYLYLHGISRGILFDEDGYPLENESGDYITANNSNFATYLTRLSDEPSLINTDGFFYVRWNLAEYGTFDYRGLAVLGNEVVLVEGFDMIGVQANEIRLIVKRGINDTVFITDSGYTLYPENTHIRSVVNIGYNAMSYSYDQKAESTRTNMFAPVVDSARLTIDDDIFKWANYNDGGLYFITRRKAAYVFSGVPGEVICDYVGFVDKFQIRTIDQKIEIMLKDKLSVIWEEDISAHKVYQNVGIKDFLSDFLNVPRNMIIYPLTKTNGLTFNPDTNLHHYDYGSGHSIYTDDDFLSIDVLATKDFEKYRDVIQDACKELAFRMKFDTMERLVIQTDVFISNDDSTYDDALTDNYIRITEVDDILNLEQTTENQIVINKIHSDFIERDTFYDRSFFLLNFLTFDVYADETLGDNVFDEHVIYNPALALGESLTSESPKFDKDGDGSAETIHVAVILNDETHNNLTTWYKWSIIKTERVDTFLGTIPSVSWGWVYKGEALGYQDIKGEFSFAEAVKYSQNMKLEGVQIMKYDANDSPEFTTIRKLESAQDEDGQSIIVENSEILIGDYISNVKIGDYVMITDGSHDFMGKISDVQFGTSTIVTPGDYQLTTTESKDKRQYFEYQNPSMEYISKIDVSTGIVEAYTFNDQTQKVTGYVTNGQAFKSYKNSYSENEIINHYDEQESSKSITKDYTIPFEGTYTGTIRLTNVDETVGEWKFFETEYVYQSNTTSPSKVDTIISNEGINEDNSYEYERIVTRVARASMVNYVQYYNVYARRRRRLVQKTLTYSGDLTLSTYKYDVHIYAEDRTEVEDPTKLNESTITIAMGYDKDYPLNYYGRHNYLDQEGYVNPMDFQMFFIRNEYPYTWEYNRSDKTATMEFPMLPGETREVNGNFGGIDDAERKYAGIVDDVNSIYGKHYGKFDPINTEEIAGHTLLYSREYHQSVPVYARSNKMTTNPDRLEYETFDNSNLTIKVNTVSDQYTESEKFPIERGIKIDEGSDSDFVASITNMDFGNTPIVPNRITRAYRRNASGTKIYIDLDPANSLTYTAYDWTKENCDNYDVTHEYKILDVSNPTDTNFYYIQQTHMDHTLDTISPVEVLGTKIIRVRNEDHPNGGRRYEVGDVLVLDKSNENNINTQTIWSKYNDSRWLISGIDRDPDGDFTDILYPDFDFPMGLNNVIPTVNQYLSKDILILQELGIKGNPYTETTHKILYENKESIEIYDEIKYEAISGKFLSLSELGTALSYVIDGFGGTSFATTKFIIPFDTVQRYDLELFDLIKVDESIYSGLESQPAIIIGKTVTVNETNTSVKYNAITIGRYESTGLPDFNETDNYQPIEIPNYDHDGNEGNGGDGVDLNNTIVSKYDPKLGNVMLNKISSDNLTAQTSKAINVEDTSMYVSSISSYFDNTTDLKNKKYYTDILLEVNQELFIKIGNEFLYCKVADNSKSSQTFVGDTTVTVPDIVTEAVLHFKTRAAFETATTQIQSNAKVEFYQISSMANGDGMYTTNFLVGDKPHREYFEFNIESGVDVTTGRGRILLNTNEDWHVQARQILYDSYDESLVNSLTEQGVQDYLGNGVIQIGRSSDYTIAAWQPLHIYEVDEQVQYKGDIYRCVTAHTSTGIFVDNVGDWMFEFSALEFGQFIRYSPVGGLELKGNVNIDSGSIKLNEVQNFNNFMHMTDSVGYLGLGVGTAPKYNPYQEGYNSYLQVGNSESNNMILFYTNSSDESVLELKSTDIDIQSINNLGSITGQLTMNNSNHILKLNSNGDIPSTVFQVGKYTGGYLRNDDHIYYGINDSGASELSMKITRGAIGNDQNYLYIDDPVDISVSVEWSFESTSERDAYFGNYNPESDSISGGTTQGRIDFQLIIDYARDRILRNILVSNVAQEWNIVTNAWEDHEFFSHSSLHINNGMQQIGSDVKDTSNPFGYRGFYFGTINSEGIGNLSEGRFLKFDANTFQIGERVSLQYGDQKIDFNNIVEGGTDNNYKGTTTFNDNLMTIYASNESKYSRSQIGGNPVTLGRLYKDTSIITIGDFSISPGTINDVSGIYEGAPVKLILRDEANEILVQTETKVISISSNGQNMTIGKIIPTTGFYELWVQNESSVLVSIGDLRNRSSMGEPIRMGHGIYQDSDTLEYATGLYMQAKDNDGSYFFYDTLNGFRLKAYDGIVDISNRNLNTVANNRGLKINDYDYRPSWDQALHPNAVDVTGWSNGYNSGVPEPEVGYHAYWINNGSGINGNPCMIFNSLNTSVGHPFRWLGISRSMGTPNDLNWSVGDRIKISWSQKVDTPNKGARLGIRHVQNSNYGFYGAERTITTSETDVWERVDFTVTVGSEWDLSRDVIIYIYGEKDSIEGSMLVDNVVIENITPKSTDPSSPTNQLFFDSSNNSYLSMNSGATQLGLLKDLPSANIPGGKNLTDYSGDIGMFIGDENGFLAYSKEEGFVVNGTFIINGTSLDDELSNRDETVNNRIDDEINNIQSNVIYSDEPPVNIVWFNIDSSTYNVFNNVTNIWETRSISIQDTPPSDTSIIWQTIDNKLSIYFESQWIPAQLVKKVTAEVPSPVKNNTMWVDTNNNQITYVYDEAYTFDKLDTTTLSIPSAIGSEVFHTVDLTGIALTDIQIAVNMFDAENGIDLYWNDEIIGRPSGSDQQTKDYVYNISYDKVIAGNNIFKAVVVNTDSAIINSVRIVAYGNKKWRTLNAKFTENLDELAKGKNTTFIIAEQPSYTPVNRTGTVSLALGSDKLVGVGTNFLDDSFSFGIGSSIILTFAGKEYRFLVKSIESGVGLTVTSANNLFNFSGVGFVHIEEVWIDTGLKETIQDDTDAPVGSIGDIVSIGKFGKGYDDATEREDFYDYRTIIESIVLLSNGKYDVITKIEKVRRPYPFAWSMEDLRNSYGHDYNVRIRPNDYVYIENYHSLGESAIFIYTPDGDYDVFEDGISIMDPVLTNANILNEFTLASASNENYILMETNRSKLFFSNNPLYYDEVKIAEDGAYGRLIVGKEDSANFFRFDSDSGLSMSTSYEIALKGGSLSLESGSTLLISSQSDMVIGSEGSLVIGSGASMSILSGGNFNVEAENVEFQSTSNVYFNSSLFSVQSDNVLFVAKEGNIILSNSNNIISLVEDTNTYSNSRILLDVPNAENESPNVRFQLGSTFKYEVDDSTGIGALGITGATLTLKSAIQDNNNVIEINENHIYCYDDTSVLANEKTVVFTKYATDIKNVETPQDPNIDEIDLIATSSSVIEVPNNWVNPKFVLSLKYYVSDAELYSLYAEHIDTNRYKIILKKDNLEISGTEIVVYGYDN